MVVKVPSGMLAKNRRFYEEAHLSFSGGGFLGIYHVGVAIAFRDFAPHIANRKVLGTSAGALAATCLVSGFPINEAINNIVKMAVHSRSLSLGPLHPRFNIVDIMRQDLAAHMPADAHVRSTGRLFVSVTRASTMQNELISKFDSREELIDVLMASCFIPYFLGWMVPKVKGVRYLDGGISRNIPVHNEHTITVSPFPGETRIGPRCGNLPKVAFAPETLLRLCKTVFAPPPAVLEELIQQGYDDAIHFLQKNDLIFCQPCVLAEKHLAWPPPPPSPSLTSLEISDHHHHGFAGDRVGVGVGVDVGVDVGVGESCDRCSELLAISDTSKVSRSLLRTLEAAAVSEQRDRQLRPFRHTRFMRTTALIFAVAIFPLEVGLAVVRKTCDSLELVWDSLQDGYSSMSASLAEMVMYSRRKGCHLCGAPGTIGPPSSSSAAASSLPYESSLQRMSTHSIGDAPTPEQHLSSLAATLSDGKCACAKKN